MKSQADIGIVKLLIHLVLWMGWLLLATFIVASIALLNEKPVPDPPDSVLKIALPVIALLSAILGWFAIHLKKHLFWIRQNLSIENGAGRAIFLGFSIAALTGGGLSVLALLAPRLLWGANLSPYFGITVGIFFLVLLFPRLPK